jgi:hypothetical protein
LRARLRSAFEPRRLLVDGAQLAGASSLAIAQPLFDLLAKNATFFAAHDLRPREIVLFALVVSLLPGLLALTAEVIVGLIDGRLRSALHVAILAGLGALFVVQAAKKAAHLTALPWLAAALLTFAAVVAAYVRLRPFRLFLTALSPTLIVFLSIFLFFSPVRKLVVPPEAKAHATAVAARTPVVMVIWDEFPVTSLMNARHQIDAGRFPHFAELASRATWFRNDNTVHEGTAGAVPAIYTGNYPRRGAYPTFGFYPHNLFTLLGGSYRLHVGETITHLCPKSLCPTPLFRTSFHYRMSTLWRDTAVVFSHLVVPDSYESRLPSVSLSWTDFRRRSRRQTTRLEMFRQFLDTIEPARRPQLYLIHIELPHGPFVFLPSCRQYETRFLEASGLGGGGDVWTRDWLVTQQFQRHLMQLQCTDRLLGLLLNRLRHVGIYDRSLVVVTADEGESFRPGDHRRAVTPSNRADIAFVPLFVKRPFQRRGAIVDAHAQATDILPTIADVLGLRIGWRTDGRSLFRPGHAARVHLTTAHGLIQPPLADLLREREQTLRRQTSLFGAGLYAVGPYPELLGKQPASLRVVDSANARGSISHALVDQLRALSRKPRVVPTPIAGTITAPGLGAGRPVAVAVNGRLVAEAETYADGGTVRFSIFAPEQSFHSGRNTVQVFLLERDGSGIVLRPVAGASA